MPFSIETPGFQGPLETLLSLIESRKLSVSDVSLSEVADAYLSYVEKLPELPLGETAQFVLVASTLLLIKSRTLLPGIELTEEENASIEELERRLARYALFKKASRLLKREWGRAPFLLARVAPPKEARFAPGEAAVPLLHAALRRVLATIPSTEKRPDVTVAPVVALEDVISSLKRRLTGAFKTRWSELTRTSDTGERIIYFLALLELVRSGSASVTQDRLFGDILLEAEGGGVPRYGV